MHGLGATILKEWRLLSRDLHGLALLFIMPASFILIMSLALQDTFDERNGLRHIAVWLHDTANTPASQRVLDQITQQPVFAWTPVADNRITRAAQIQQDKAAAMVTLSTHEEDLHAQLLVAPSTTRQTEALLTATLERALSRERITRLWREHTYTQALAGNGITLSDDTALEAALRNTVSVEHAGNTATATPDQAPDSVQQNVPAWLVFAMFFSVVPLSSTLITERQQGTLRRLRTLPVHPTLPLMGKLIPYFLINQLQVLLMLGIGVYLIPLLGANRLSLGQSWTGLALVSSCLSIAALGYGILVAVLCHTSEQATLLGGTGNLLLAAIGGIMVPRFVMPDTMQQLSRLSPMSWGLDGFLDLFLRHGTVTDVLPEAATLLLFGTVTMTLAFVLAGKRT